MALDVGLKSDDGGDDPLDRGVVVSLPFAYYSFLMEYFARFTAQTGTGIDHYDDAYVSGDDLKVLEEQVVLALAQAAQQPDVWDEWVGFETGPRRADLYEKIERRDLLAELQTLRRLIQRAASQDKVLMFFGD